MQTCACIHARMHICARMCFCVCAWTRAYQDLAPRLLRSLHRICNRVPALMQQSYVSILSNHTASYTRFPPSKLVMGCVFERHSMCVHETGESFRGKDVTCMRVFVGGRIGHWTRRSFSLAWSMAHTLCAWQNAWMEQESCGVKGLKELVAFYGMLVRVLESRFYVCIRVSTWRKHWIWPGSHPVSFETTRHYRVLTCGSASWKAFRLLRAHYCCFEKAVFQTKTPASSWILPREYVLQILKMRCLCNATKSGFEAGEFLHTRLKEAMHSNWMFTYLYSKWTWFSGKGKRHNS